MVVKDAQGDKRLTSKILKIKILAKARALARGVLGLLVNAPETLNAFASAGNDDETSGLLRTAAECE